MAGPQWLTGPFSAGHIQRHLPQRPPNGRTEHRRLHGPEYRHEMALGLLAPLAPGGLLAPGIVLPHPEALNQPPPPLFSFFWPCWILLDFAQ